MRLPLSIIAVAINIIVFVAMGTFLLVETEKSNLIFTTFLILLEIGCALNTLLIVTAY